MERILIIRLSAIGDVLLTTLLVRVLRNRYPEAIIDFLVKEAYVSLLHESPHIDNVLPFSPRGGWRELRTIIRRIRRNRYDGIVDLQASPRTFLFRLLSGSVRRVRHRPRRGRRFLLVKFGLDTYKNISPIPLRYLESVADWDVEDDGRGLEFVVQEEDRESILSKMRDDYSPDGRKMIVLAPGAGRATKRWLPEGFSDVGGYFSKQGYTVVLTGGVQDKEICERVSEKIKGDVINLAGECTLGETAALLERSALLITNDTGVMHMASALGRKVVALFGPTTHHLGFFPFRVPCVVVEKLLSCRPCSYHGTASCPERHFRCMKEISSADVIDAAETLLKKG